jgi:hypothetical protein
MLASGCVMGFHVSPGFVTIPDVDSIVALCIHIFHLSDCSLSCWAVALLRRSFFLACSFSSTSGAEFSISLACYLNSFSPPNNCTKKKVNKRE